MFPETVMRADYYYVGNFDDEILRFSDDVELDINTINFTLSQAAIAGSPLLINDGYLMHYPAGRLALTDPGASPLLDLIDAGFVQLFSRNGESLANMPYRMAHIESYARLLKDPAWDQMRETLVARQGPWISRGAIVRWPKKDVGPGFQRLINIAFANLSRSGLPEYLGDNQVSDLIARYNRTLDGNRSLAARATWTLLFNDPDLAFSEPARKFLHWMGIEAYHYNLAMVSALAKEGSLPGVVTRWSSLFSEIQATPAEVEGGATLHQLPHPKIPVGCENRLLEGKFLARLVSPNLDRDLSVTRARYLSMQGAAMRDSAALEEAYVAAARYGEAITRALSESSSCAKMPLTQYVNVAVSGVTGVLGGAILRNPEIRDFATLHPVATGLAAVAAISVAASVVTPFVRDLIHGLRPHSDIAIDVVRPLEQPSPSPNTLPHPRNPDKWFAFVPVNSVATTAHVESLPPL